VVSQVTINPTADLGSGTDYYVEIANGAITDIAGNNYAGITGNSTWNFTTVAPADTTPPTASSLSPADNATGVGVADNLVINFSEAIQKGTGNLVIKKLSDNSVVETIAVTAANVTVSGPQVTINPTADLGSGIDYYVEIADGAITDIAGNNYAGITGDSTWNFTTVAPADTTPPTANSSWNFTTVAPTVAPADTTPPTANSSWNFTTVAPTVAPADTTPPTASSVNPADNATGVGVADNLVFNFSEALQKGIGNLDLKKLSDNSVLETIAATAANVTVSARPLTINPTADLGSGTDYYVEIANGAITDIAGNNYAGITGNSTWNCTTQGTAAINGTAGADNLTGTASSDIINGLAGNDTLNGGAGNDSLMVARIKIF
jgi:methionine-rich copper-binding protein CopC